MATIRQWLRRILLWLAAALEDEAAPERTQGFRPAGRAEARPTLGRRVDSEVRDVSRPPAVRQQSPLPAMRGEGTVGPPTDWLERVRRSAPQLLEPDATAPQRAPYAPPPPQFHAAPAAPREVPAKPRRTRTVIDEELVARRAHVGDGSGGRIVPRLRPVLAQNRLAVDGWRLAVGETTCAAVAPANRQPTTDNRQPHPWPELPPRLAVDEATYAAGAPANRQPSTANRQPDLWPELPPFPPLGDEIETLDDADRLRRIAGEQRGTAWSE